MIKSKICLFAGLMFATLAVEAATKITISCTAPTTRADNSVLAASEIGGFSFFYQKPAAALTQIPPVGLVPNCGREVPIAKGTCFVKGTVFSATVTDNSVPALTSDPGTYTLPEDICNPFAKPAKPVVTVTHD